jgi:hypothetical protein
MRQLYWWRSVMWLLVNVVVLYLIYTNIVFYPNIVKNHHIARHDRGLVDRREAFWLAISFIIGPFLAARKANMLLAWKHLHSCF